MIRVINNRKRALAQHTPRLAMKKQNQTPGGNTSRRGLLSGLKDRRSVQDLIAPLAKACQKSGCLFHAPLEPFELGNVVYRMPRFAFIGPGSGGSYYKRLGLFAGLHGDEIAGPHAVVEFLHQLETSPLLGKGWEIFAYPVCNPSGFEDNTRFSRRGVDLNRLFWKKSREAEVQILEDQIRGMQFDGIISLHADDSSNGIYGFARGAEITRDVLEPALEAASAIIPRNNNKRIDGFDAENGIISKCYSGVLSASPDTQPRPFEIVLETPQLAPLKMQVEAHVTALLTLVAEYPKFISYGQDL